MEGIERFFRRKRKPKGTKTVSKSGGKSNEELQGELQGLARMVEKGHPDQQNIVNFMGTEILSQIAARESGNKEREPHYQDDIEVLIRTEKEHLVGVKMKKKNFKVVFKQGEFSKESVLEALHLTYPDYEVHTKPPLFIPAEWIEDLKQQGFTGIRKPLDKLYFGHTRALWLTVDEFTSDSESYDILNNEGEVEQYSFGNKSLVVQAEPEIKNTVWSELPPADGSDTGWYPQKYWLRELPELQNAQNKLGSFLSNLLKDDNIAALSVRPNGFDVPMTLREAKKYPKIHPVAQEKLVQFDGPNTKESIEKVNREAEEEKKYVFETGVNEYGILQQRRADYVLPFLFTRVKFYPSGGLSFDELNPEIERMRRV